MFLIEKEKQVFFLENLLNRLRNNHLSVEEQQKLSEFYIHSMFSETYNNNNEEDNQKYMSYMSLGWYIYEILNKDKKIQ
jgi:hypothetical protein